MERLISHRLFEAWAVREQRTQQAMLDRQERKQTFLVDCANCFDAWDRAPDFIDKKDPARVQLSILLKMSGLQEDSPKYAVLGDLLKEYTRIPYEDRQLDEVNSSFLSRLEELK